jgi:hypothetical protein
MKRKILIIVGFFGALLLASCYPDGPDYAEELDVVLTYHNPDYIFGTKTTYAMPDKIVKITGNLQEGDAPSFIPATTAALILSRIEENMTALGYQRVSLESEGADLLLLPAAWETTTVSVWYDYWYWWYGGYYPGWGWGGGYYPYYPPVYVSSYTTGTLIMNLMDKTEIGANGNPVLEWTGAINGVMTNTYDATRINTAIDKAFDQSPYLKTN